MKQKLEVSIQMIKILNIKSKKEYIRLLKYYNLLSLESLKYIAGTRYSKKVFKKLRQVN